MCSGSSFDEIADLCAWKYTERVEKQRFVASKDERCPMCPVIPAVIAALQVDYVVAVSNLLRKLVFHTNRAD